MIKSNSITKKILGLFLCVLVCLMTAFTVKYLYSSLTAYFTSDYEFYSAEEDPKVGEVISLDGLKDKDGNSFYDAKHKNLILLGIIDSDCGACLVAKDQIKLIQEGIENLEVEYVFVSFTSNKTSDEFSNYVKANYQSTNSFLWENISLPSPKSLSTAVVPSHILIDSNGTILKTFVGTDRDDSTRKRMANKIIKEINKTIK